MSKRVWSVVSAEEAAQLRARRPSSLGFLRSRAVRVIAVGPLIACNPMPPSYSPDSSDLFPVQPEDSGNDEDSGDDEDSGHNEGSGEDSDKAGPA